VARQRDDELFCPGSILRVELDPLHPLAYGMPPRTAGFFTFSSAYEITAASHGGSQAAGAPTDRVDVIARYGARELLISGWLEGEARIAGHPAVVQASVGAGRVVLLGFRVQHRGQSYATFRLLFNALYAAR
jgi:hypothetical protein